MDPYRVTVAIPSHPGRERLLRRALASVATQDRSPAAVSVAVDLDREGSAATRNRALAAVQTPWVAFLDSDDMFLPEHLALLTACAQATGADVVYPIPTAEGHPLPALRFGLPFDPDALRRANYIPVTVLARTALVKAAGGFQPPPVDEHDPERVYDDWGCFLAMLALGARFVHLPARTWVWHFHPGQTQGQSR